MAIALLNYQDYIVFLTMKKVIVVGSGLAGLVAALRMQQAGYYVEVFEKSNRFGGLCGTHVLDSYEFVLACNDFGSGLPEASYL